MKRYIVVFGALMLLSASYGCSPETRRDIKEVGHDMGRDMEEAGREMGDAVEDATD